MAAIRRHKQSRWRGDTQKLIDTATEMSQLVRDRTGEEPAVIGVIRLKGEDEDHYVGLEQLKSAINSRNNQDLARIREIQFDIGSHVGAALTVRATVAPNASLVELEVSGRDTISVNELRTAFQNQLAERQETFRGLTEAISKTVGRLAGESKPPRSEPSLLVSIILRRVAPAIALEIQSDDDLLADGVRERIKEQLGRAKPRIGAPPFLVTYLIAAFAAFLYGVGLATLGLFDWLPSGLGGTLLYFVVVFLPGAAVAGLVFWVVNSVLLPPLNLHVAGTPAPRFQLVRRTWPAVAFLLSVIVPLILTIVNMTTTDK